MRVTNLNCVVKPNNTKVIQDITVMNGETSFMANLEPGA